jgi:hypothetical protein
MRLRSQLSTVVAGQLGKLQGRLEATLLTRLQTYTQLFRENCPNAREVTQVLNLLNTIDTSLSSLERSKSTFRQLSSRLNRTITATSTLIRTLRLLPVPTAVAGVGVPIGLTNRYAETLIDASDFLEKLQADQRNIAQLVDTADSLDLSVKSRVDTLLDILRACADSDPEIARLISNIQRVESRAFSRDSNLGSYRALNGKDYFFEIIQDTVITKPVPRRIAIARDRSGVIVLRGSPSFSSTTKVLIDELKLRIERQLP